jgi:predicted DNA-binding transcriptional regulator YafY
MTHASWQTLRTGSVRNVWHHRRMVPTSARLLRLLSLLQARPFWSGPDLAEKLEVTGRTLRRDVDRLRSLGYPVHSTSGTAGGYKLGAGARLPPLLLDDDEAVAVAVGLQTAAGGSVSEIGEASLRALGKLEQVLPPRLRRRLAVLRSSIVRLSDSGPTVRMGDVSLLASACSERRELRFRYRDRGGAPSSRTVEPHRIVHMSRRWYLVAWDPERNDWRTFRIDRLEGCTTTGAHFVPRAAPDDDVGAYVSRGVEAVAYKVRARITLHAPVETIRKRFPHLERRLEPADADSCVLSTGAGSLAELAAWLPMFGVDFDVRDPPELRAHLQRLATRLSRAASG